MKFAHIGRFGVLTGVLAVGVGIGGLLARPAAEVEASPMRVACAVYFSPMGGVEEALIQAIESSKKEILVAMYVFTSRPLAMALKRAHGRGVQVRMITDKDSDKIRGTQGKELEDVGIEVVYADLGKTGDNQPIKFHHKYVVIDQEVVATGSYNWTRQGHTDNRENIVVLYGKPIAQAFRQNFAREHEALTAAAR